MADLVLSETLCPIPIHFMADVAASLVPEWRKLNCGGTYPICTWKG